MARGMKNFQRDVAKADEVSIFHITVWRRKIDLLMHDHRGIGTMDNELGSRYSLQALIPRGMVRVTMGIDDIDTSQIVLGQRH
jgi:hypothetical protein